VGQRLDGATALVTGAGSGIGRAITLRFVAEGARVAAVDLGIDTVRALADSAPRGAVVPVVADVTDEAQLSAAVADAVAALGPLGVVVANAGRGTFAPIVDHDTAEWRSILDLCLTGVFLTIKHAAPAMRDGGSIITIASLNAIQPSAGMSAYCAAKAGAVALTRVAAMELGGRGIRANAIAPGLVQTAASSSFWELPGVVEEFVANTTVGRFATPDDVAGMAVYLASDESSFVSGSMLSIDGGASTKRYPDLPAAIDRLTGGSE
jgi:NAD(P)-dependent dehydrogenase (short-subunit alcohol dehydrogenase family)